MTEQPPKLQKPLIPWELQTVFEAVMQANDHNHLSDGAWQAVLEEAGRRFLIEHKLKGDGNDAFHFYLNMGAP